MFKHFLLSIAASLLASGLAQAAVVGDGAATATGRQTVVPGASIQSISGGTLLLGVSDPGNPARVEFAGKFNANVVSRTAGALTLSHSSSIGAGDGVAESSLPAFAAGSAVARSGGGSGSSRTATPLEDGGAVFSDSGRDPNAGISAQWNPVMFYSDAVASALDVTGGASAASASGGILSWPGALTIFGVLALAGFIGYRQRQKVADFVRQIKGRAHSLFSRAIAAPSGAPILPRFLNIQPTEHPEIATKPAPSKPSKPTGQTR